DIARGPPFAAIARQAVADKRTHVIANLDGDHSTKIVALDAAAHDAGLDYVLHALVMDRLARLDRLRVHDWLQAQAA
ncbi:hypothetical protein ABTM87_20295, partial [Acinetobacter baumannii]